MDDTVAKRNLDPFRSDVFSTGIFERPGRVLVIDDDPVFCQAVTDILQHENHTVDCVESGVTGLAAAAHAEPDLILIDVRLPEMNGFELCRKFKSDPELRYVPVMLLTGLAN